MISLNHPSRRPWHGILPNRKTGDDRGMLRHIKQPTFAELFAPKLITVLREGYGFADFRADAIAGLTVAIVALPLSMAIAIASGVTPDRGLHRFAARR
jgi:SulP family sulfate permease